MKTYQKLTPREVTEAGLTAPVDWPWAVKVTVADGGVSFHYFRSEDAANDYLRSQGQAVAPTAG